MAQVTLYGGVGEIGGNKVLVEEGDSRILLDFGTSFRAWDRYFAEFVKPRTNSALRDLLNLGIVPAIDGIYRSDACLLDGIEAAAPCYAAFRDLWCAGLVSYEEYGQTHGRPFVDGIVLSHAHMDHVGQLGFLDPAIPVYATPATVAMLDAIQDLGTAGMEVELIRGGTRVLTTTGPKANFPGQPDVGSGPQWQRTVVAQPPNAPTRVGDFTVTLLPVDHSVPGAACTLVETLSGKRILYSGDIRFHGTMGATTQALREHVRSLRPDLMLCEGTRIANQSGDSEEDVFRGIRDIVRECRGLAMVDFGWKDTTRFETLQRVAAESGKTLVVSHRLAYSLRLLSQADACIRPIERYDNVKVYVRRMAGMLYAANDYNGSARDRLRLGYRAGKWDGADPDALVHWRNGVRATDIRRHPERYILMLTQWEMPELLDLDPPVGSIFIRAACEPFNDDMESDLERQANWLKAWSIPVAGDDTQDGAAVPMVKHASGHACGPDILDFVRLVNPRRVVPMHTEHPGAFCDLECSIELPQVGKPISL